MFFQNAIGDHTETREYHCDNPRAIALICHPHPLYGGTHDNKVITTLARTLQKNQIAVLTFNFRGVGASVGVHDFGAGESEDVIALSTQWRAQFDPKMPFLLLGFSFGGDMAYQAAQHIPNIAGLFTLAAPLVYLNAPLVAPNYPWFALLAGADEVIDSESAETQLRALPVSPNIQILAESSHFFHGKLANVQEWLVAGLNKIF